MIEWLQNMLIPLVPRSRLSQCIIIIIIQIVKTTSETYINPFQKTSAMTSAAAHIRVEAFELENSKF